jgi:hypothetical protein
MPDEEIEVDPQGEPILDQFSADGFVDCTFRIAEIFSDTESHRLRLSAVYRGELVGCTAMVRPRIRGGFDTNMELIRGHVYRRAVQILRVGPESDRLLTALAELYGLPKAPLRMAAAISFTGIALHQDGIDMEMQPITIKLFGCDSDEEIERDEYFESFFILDLPSGFVFWNEKDVDYREALIRGLSDPSPPQDST